MQADSEANAALILFTGLKPGLVHVTVPPLHPGPRGPGAPRGGAQHPPPRGGLLLFVPALVLHPYLLLVCEE